MQAVAPSILIVEDSPLHARIMMSMLDDIGIPHYKVGAAPQLADALALASRWRPDCVLLDLTLPDASGIEAVEAMVAALPDVPVIVVSASDDPNIALAAVKAGAQEFMPKWPADAEDFASLVRLALARGIAAGSSDMEAAPAAS
jgi:CheY-like chemotaxis protein